MSVVESNNQNRNLAAADALKLQGTGLMINGIGMTNVDENHEIIFN